MGPLEKLRTRMLSSRRLSPTGTRTTVKESSISVDHQRCSGGAHLVWNEARRTHSDPTPLRAASDAEAGRDQETVREEVTEEDDDVFYDTGECLLAHSMM